MTTTIVIAQTGQIVEQTAAMTPFIADHDYMTSAGYVQAGQLDIQSFTLSFTEADFPELEQVVSEYLEIEAARGTAIEESALGYEPECLGLFDMEDDF